MARMEMAVSFAKVQVGSKIVEILQKRCCSVDVLQEIPFYHLVRAN